MCPLLTFATAGLELATSRATGVHSVLPLLLLHTYLQFVFPHSNHVILKHNLIVSFPSLNSFNSFPLHFRGKKPNTKPDTPAPTVRHSSRCLTHGLTATALSCRGSRARSPQTGKPCTLLALGHCPPPPLPGVRGLCFVTATSESLFLTSVPQFKLGPSCYCLP